VIHYLERSEVQGLIGGALTRRLRDAATAGGWSNRSHGVINRIGSKSDSQHLMLELRPTCENCDISLPPDSLEARICSYECTFCATCVESVLHNVCPNCGGGFVPRPTRPSKNWKGDNFLGKDPASKTIRHRPVDPVAHAQFSGRLRIIPPEKR